VKRKHPAFWWPLGLLFLADCTSKRYATEYLEIPHVPHEVLGDVLRFTLAYNPGAAFSLSLGEHSRWILAAVAVLLLGLLFRFYRQTERHDATQALALALIAGGAMGNLLDRLRSPLGVVDFIDIGLGDMRLWTFNVADVGVVSGAVLLALLLLRRETAADPLSAAPGGRSAPPPPSSPTP
jgi:signal peptidase II